MRRGKCIRLLCPARISFVETISICGRFRTPQLIQRFDVPLFASSLLSRVISISVMEPDVHSESETDHDLIALIASGDEAAFSRFYDRHAALMFSCALAILRNAAEAEDLVQETCLRVWDKAVSFDRSRGTPIAWVMTMVRSRAIDRLRSSRSKRELIDRASEDASASTGTDDETAFLDVAMRETAVELRAAMADLSVEQRKVLELAYFRGLSQSEIAEHLGEPIGTIKARARRGMIHLRDRMKPFVETG